MQQGSASIWAIVLTHGGAEEITAACIESLRAQDYSGLTILLVDNDSFDKSGERLRDRFPDIRYINTGGNLGYTGGNNHGIAYAIENGAAYVLILNNDTVVEPNCVTVLARSASEAGQFGAIAPKILYWDDPDHVWYAGGDFSAMRAIGMHRGIGVVDDPAEKSRLEPMTFATGCCFLMPAEVAAEMGGFREDFFIYCEDVELSLRLTRAGYPMYYQPAARLLHREPPGKRLASPFATRMRDRNRRRLVRQHYGWLDRLAFMAWFYPTRAVRFAQHLMKGDIPGARAVVAGMIEA
jgi:GT2 family glycosyltransferase